ncbi:acetyl-CoA carboxylase biotin carboxyl carrier protein [Aporhodopirellula aestuarii]|uniref:Biotin carboxyl carrier protein of acetyl-CoA carboxylase n=1 Tax=Aporhodopirellula aestuarii TaxID=2950107 RepID=A0ABT0U0V3_9BACT|nr:acetyl-CoA carboxylase biotin carboxyl carrier protein [Aporhodopirellula aestuarii]MCM2370475.1 acetyl-CoA carboxylase biotin carboxyl carrier protein [Aporhodopirellula aestuarii]
MTADSPKSGSTSKSDRSKSSQASRSGDVFDIDRIRQIVELMEQHELSEVDLQQSDDRIRLTRGSSQVPAAAPPAYAPPAAAPAPAPAAAAPAPAAAGPAAPPAGTITINSPMVGTFYARANPEAPAFVKVGDSVSEDTVVCIVEAMKVFNEIPAECSGKVVEVLASDQEAVDFGKPLFRIQTGG